MIRLVGWRDSANVICNIINDKLVHLIYEL